MRTHYRTTFVKLTITSGSATVDSKSQLVVIDNVRTGFDLWDLSNDTHLQTFPTGKPTRYLPRKVAFAEGGKTIICGSDHGLVFVFDRQTGAPLDVLQHATGNLSQTVAVSTTSRQQ